MIIAFWVFSLAVAQAIVNKYVLSSRIRFTFSVSVASLSAIPLLIQLFILVSELRLLPWKYWIKLPLHRLLMSLFGEHGPAINLVVKQYSLKTELKKFGDRYTYEDEFKKCALLRSSIGHMAHFVARVLSWVVLNDAFSGMSSIKTVSQGIFLLSDHWLNQALNPSDDRHLAWGIGCRISLLSSNSIVDFRQTIPHILRDLKARRGELVVQINGIYPDILTREKICSKICDRMNRLIPKQDEYANWRLYFQNGTMAWDPPLGQNGNFDWHLLFKLEENFRGEVLKGEELVVELVKLWTFRNGITLFDTNVFLHPNMGAGPMVEPRAVTEARVKTRAWALALAWARWGAGAGTWTWTGGAKAKGEAEAEEQIEKWRQVGAWMLRRAQSQAQARGEAGLAMAEEEPRLGPKTEMDGQTHVAPEEVEVERGVHVHSITKVIRNVELLVAIALRSTDRHVSCSVRATGSQDGYVSKLYYREFAVRCELRNAAELYNLMESLDENTFLLSGTTEDVRAMDVYSCRPLESTIISILESGRRVVPYRFRGRVIYV